jgi:hypothetical protein
LQKVRFSFSSGSSIKRLTKIVAIFAVGVFGALSVMLVFGNARASASTNDYINFQARLLNSSGTVVPDGNYHIEFKIYDQDGVTGNQGSCSGHCLWVETRSTGNLVKVVNGYFSVSLGSVTAFPAGVNWNQQLYLTMRIGGSGGSPSWDGEMQNSSHSIALTGVPYAFRAGSLASFNGTQTGTLSFGPVTNSPVLTLPNETGTLCSTGSVCSGYASSASLAGYVQLQGSTPGSTQTGNFNISGTGIASVLSASTYTGSGNLVIKPGADSTTAVQIQNSAGTSNLFAADTTNSKIYIGAPGKTAAYLYNFDNNILGIGPSAYIESSLAVSGSGYAEANKITTLGTNSSSSTPLYVKGYAGGQSADLLQVAAYSTPWGSQQVVLGVSENGDIYSRNIGDSPTAFQIQNAAEATLFGVDTSGSVITVAGTTSTFATLTLTNAHFKSTQTTAPTIGTPTNCGTSPTAAVTTGSTDSAGSFTVTAGTSGGYNKTYGTAPKSIILQPTTAVGSATGLKAAQVSATSATTFTIKLTTSPGGDGEKNSYYYWVIE